MKGTFHKTRVHNQCALTVYHNLGPTMFVPGSWDPSDNISIDDHSETVGYELRDTRRKRKIAYTGTAKIVHGQQHRLLREVPSPEVDTGHDVQRGIKGGNCGQCTPEGMSGDIYFCGLRVAESLAKALV